MERPQSLWDKSHNPILQASIAFGITMVIIIGGLIFKAMGLIETDKLFPWTATTAIMLCFALFNSIFSLAAPDVNKYWSRSVMSFGGLAILSGLVAYFVSNTSIGDAKTYKWIYFVIIFGYLVFLSIIRFMKGIIDFAQKEEWNQPKIRKRR